MNVLVYRFDSRFREKQAISVQLLRRGIADQIIRIQYPPVLEVVAATTRRRGKAEPLLEPTVAHREAEEFLAQFDILK